MATPIKIKYSTGTAAPGSLSNGELAFTANGNVLYIGSAGSVTAIGIARNPGVLTANQALVANSTSYLDVIKTANLYIGSVTVNVINTIANSTVLGAAGNNELTSTWAIKTYVDAKVAAGGAVAGSNTNIQFNDSSSPGGSAGFTFDKTSNIVAISNTLNIGANVSLTTAKLLIGNSTVNTNILLTGATFANSTVSSVYGPIATIGANVTLDTTKLFIGNSTVNGTYTSASLALANSTVAATYGLSTTIGANVTLSTTGLLVGNSTANVVVLGTSVAHVNSTGNTVVAPSLVSSGNSTVNTALSATNLILANSTSTMTLTPLALTVGATTINSTGYAVGANNFANATHNYVGNSTVYTYETATTWGFVDAASNVAGNTSTLKISNSTVNATLSANGLNSGSTVIGQSSISVTDITVTGNLTVSGTLAALNATNLSVTDSMIKLANGQNTADALSIGQYGVYGNSTVTQFAGLFRDQSNGAVWTLFNTQKEPTTTVDTSNNTYSIGTLFAKLSSYGLVSNGTNLNLTANSTLAVAITANTLSLTTQLPVSSGGTGLNTITASAVMVGNGTGPITLVSGSDGLVMASVSGVPTFVAIDGGTF